MVITRIVGGLGNQLFQYSLGKAIALEQNTDLKIDISSFNNYRLRNFELSNFNVCCEVMRDSDRPYIFHNRKWRSIETFVNICAGRPRVMREETLKFDSKILEIGGDIYLDGYWQSPNYFSRHWHILKREFELKVGLGINESKISQDMEKVNSVSVHVRRGDYVATEANKRLYYECSPAYYAKAFEYLQERFVDLKFYFFSDDIEWVARNIQIPGNSTIIDGNRSWVDMKLMSSCKHSVIANSTLSWWGAFLKRANDLESVVISPAKWFNDEMKNIEISGLVPESWIRL